MKKQLVRVLLIEDNPGDIELIRNAFDEIEVEIALGVLSNGLQVAQAIKDGTLQADIILLDVNIPIVNGFEILSMLKSNQQTKLLPVIMLTSSSAPDDIKKSYVAGANCFMTKPADYNGLLKTISHFAKFWIDIVKLPNSANIR